MTIAQSAGLCDMATIAVTPILGEFGYIVFDIQPRVRAWLQAQKAERKVVFAPRELASLFEEATEIIEPPLDLLPTAPATMRSVFYDCWRPDHPERQKIERLVQWARSTVNADSWLEIPYFDSEPWTAPAIFGHLHGPADAPVPQKPYIVVAARARAFDSWRNWPAANWDKLVRRIRDQWQTDVYAIGRPPSTYFPQGCISQTIDELHRLDSSLTLLNHAVCSISSNSGPTHLSLMAACPTFAWGEPGLKDFMERQTNPLNTCCNILPVGWRPDVETVWRGLCDWRTALEKQGLWKTIARLKPRVSMCMIARDSSRTIHAALSSVRPWVDEMIVLDTGSTDNTVSIAESCGAAVHHIAWDDSFSAARNQSINHASGEWVFWMDSDDTISASQGEKLKELASRRHSPSTMGFVLQVHCPADPQRMIYSSATVVDHVKMFRNLPAIRFSGRIHEQVLGSIRRLGGIVEWTDIAILHSGSDQTPEGRVRKQSRDLRLLELEAGDNPDNTFTLFNLGMTLLDCGEAEQALCALARSLQLSEQAESHVRKIYALLVQSYMELRRINTAYWTCLQGLSVFADDPELIFRKGVIEQSLGRLHEAEVSFLAALQVSPTRHFSSIDTGIIGAKAWHNLAILYASQNRHELAAAAWKKTIESEPANRGAWRGLLNSLAALRDIQAMNNVINDCSGNQSASDIVALAQAKVWICRNDPYAAASILEEAYIVSGSLDLLQELCEIAFQANLTEVAERQLKTLTERCPNEASAFRNLGIIYLRAQRKADAIECATRAINLRPDYTAAHDLLRLANELA